MTEITPTYYAAGVYRHYYALKGRGLNAIPADAVAIPSPYNQLPLVNINSDDPNVVMTIVSRTPNEIVFASQEAVQHNATFIGGIVSSDRQVVYWVNWTEPLP